MEELDKKENKETGENKEDTSDKKSRVFLVFSISVIIILVLTLIGFAAFKELDKSSENNINSPFKRSVKIDDIQLNTEFDFFNMGYKFNIVPQVDIDGLKLRIIFLDKNSKLVERFDKYVGNLKEGLQVSFMVSFSSMDNFMKVHSCQVNILEGEVSYFA